MRGDLRPGPNAINAGTGRMGCGTGTHNAGRDGTRERPRDATTSSGPSRAGTQGAPTVNSGRDSRVAARPVGVIDALKINYSLLNLKTPN